MKKNFILLLTSLAIILTLLAGTANAADSVTRITLEEKEVDEYSVCAVLKGFTETGKLVWTKQTNVRGFADSPYGEIGISGEKYYYSDAGTIVALNKNNGDIIWKNNDFGGGYIEGTIGADGTIYLCDAYGPTFGVIDAYGKTKKRMEDFPDGLDFPDTIKLMNDNIIVIRFGADFATDAFDVDYYIDLTDYSHAKNIHSLVVGDLYDVSQKAWYADSVRWALQKNITNGTGAHTFSPSDTCTTAQILTFLWRAVGTPELDSSNMFTDVKTSDYYYKAALWSAKQGLVAGSQFNGNAPCTRASTVTYLWKLSGSPDISGTSFDDVPLGSVYEKAVIWAVSNGITNGTGNNNFSPDQVCSRAQIVTFLNRYISNNLISSTSNRIDSSTWKDIYQQFVFSNDYLSFEKVNWYKPNSGNHDYYPINFSLHDVDANGIPELIIYNGGESIADAGWRAFSFDGNKVVNLGSLGFRRGEFNLINNSKYPGLYYAAAIAGGPIGYGEVYGVYYEISGGKISDKAVLTKLIESNTLKTEIEQNTDDNNLFNACQNQLGNKLDFYTESEIDQMGWNEFCKAYGF